MQQFVMAADLYVVAKNHEKACEIYIKHKNTDAATKLISGITTPKIHALYAKIMEQTGKYKAALKSYTITNDYTSMIRLYLQQLNRSHDAFELARKTNDSKCAELVAAFARKNGDNNAAIEFYIISEQFDVSFELAKKLELLDVFGHYFIKYKSTNTNFTSYSGKLATMFTESGDVGSASFWHMKEGKYSVALKYALQVDNFNSAIDVIKESANSPEHEKLVQTLLEALQNVEDPVYKYRLAIVLEKNTQAAELALNISNEYQRMGKYKDARDMLVMLQKDFYAKKLLYRTTYINLWCYYIAI
eukprot:UN23734